VCLTKFFMIPILIVLLCYLTGLHGEPAAALFIVSCMPTGVMVPALSIIYNLDIDLANAGYLWTTLIYMIFILPLMMWCLHAPLFR
jgi:predicted permease